MTNNYLAKKVSDKIQTIILILLSAFYVFKVLYNQTETSEVVLQSFVAALTLLAVWSLYILHSNFASYVVLLLIGYIDGAYNFLRWFLSFNFQNGFVGDFPWINLVLLVGSVYLFLMAISFFLHEGFTFNRECFNLTQLLILFPILMFLTYGMNILIAVLVVEFVACNYRPIASHFLMLSKSIVLPFALGKIIATEGIANTNFGHWFLTILALYIIFLIVIDFFKEYKKHKEETCVDCDIKKEVEPANFDKFAL